MLLFCIETNLKYKTDCGPTDVLCPGLFVSLVVVCANYNVGLCLTIIVISGIEVGSLGGGSERVLQEMKRIRRS
jgi:hypothetical protein